MCIRDRFHCASVKLSSGEPVTNFMRSIGQSGGVIVILVLHNGFSGSVVSLVSVIVVGVFIFIRMPVVSVPAGTENEPCRSPVIMTFVIVPVSDQFRVYPFMIVPR